MKPYFILTNRKRAIVALVHTVVFLTVALSGFVTTLRPLRAASPASSWILAAVYVLVTAALLLLAAFSRRPVERFYFALCATSAGFGLLRQIVGDPAMHAAVYIRVAMLAAAVLVGISILRGHRKPGDRRNVHLVSPAAPAPETSAQESDMNEA